MSRLRARYERGQALLLLLMVIAMGSTWYLTSRLNAESGAAPAIRKARNAEVLNRAKQTLIGYIAAQAIKAGENRPGAFPCPVAPADFNDPAANGSDGTVSYPCALPIVGRFPWRTLGLDKLVDSSGEPLWYAIASGWAGANTVINSECAGATADTGLICSSPGGRLSVDGVPAANSDVIALIIAPGPSFAAPASTGCTAWNQVRPTAAPPDLRNYLECENASSTASFVTSKPPIVNPVTKLVTPVFNDQVVTITVGEVMPAIEAAIAKRIEREIVPALQTVYTPAAWGFTGMPVTSNPVLPYPAAFANPGPGVGTSPYQGAAGLYKGLLPFNQANCTPAAANPRCSNILLAFAKFGLDGQISGGGSIRTQSTCAWQATKYVCTGEYNAPTVSISFRLRVTNVAMGLRAFDASKVTCTAVDDVGAGIGTQSVACAASVALQSDGTALLTVNTGAMPDIVGSGWGTYANYMINIDRLAFGDHALLDTADATTGWFVRNEWFRLVYYAVAPSNTAIRLAAASPNERSCSAVGDCLTLTTSAGAVTKSALLVLAGRSLNGLPRPRTTLPALTLEDYLEFGNVTAAYETRTITPKPASVYTDTGGANAYAVAITSLATGATFHFRAANANTGTSTLNTAATGTRSLVNENGSNLAAGTIQANAAVQATWDGTQFVLSKRPFNDRIVAISSN